MNVPPEPQQPAQPSPADKATPAPDAATPPQAARETNQVQNVGEAEVTHFITTIKNAEQQVGEHVIQALQHPDTVAVLTSVVLGPNGQQHIVSAALNASQTAEINRLLQSATEEREEETLCVGFHCLIKPKQKPADPDHHAPADG